MNEKIQKLAEYLRQAHYPSYMELVKLAFVNEAYEFLYDTELLENLLSNLIHFESEDTGMEYDEGNKEEESKMWLEEFFDLNSMVFVEHTPISKLGEGAYGAAFETEEGRVLKVFRGIELYRKHQKDLESLHDGTADKNRPMIYDSGIFKLPTFLRPKGHQRLGKVTLFYVVLEKVDQIDSDSRTYLIEQVDWFVREQEANISYIETESYFNRLVEVVFDDVKDTHQSEEAFLEQLKEAGLTIDEFRQLISMYITRYQQGEKDTGAENMGYRGNTPVSFDFADPTFRMSPGDEKIEEVSWEY
jgi:hypothetical protein